MGNFQSRLVAAVLGCAAVMLSSTGAACTKAAAQAYKAGDYASVAQICRPLADAGDVAGQFTLAQLYLSGRGASQSDAKAFKWLALAAAQGHAPAQTNLATMFATGRGVDKNNPLAIQWFTAAAEQGFAPAQHSLARSYYAGLGVPRDHAKAVKWHLAAAHQGHLVSQHLIAQMFDKGEGVSLDPVVAFAWYCISEALGYSPATVDRDRLRKLLRPAEIDQADELAAAITKSIFEAQQ